MISKNFQTIEDLLLDESFWNYYFQKDEDAQLDWQDWFEDNAERTALVNEARQLLDMLSLKWSEDQIKERLNELNFRLDNPNWTIQTNKHRLKQISTTQLSPLTTHRSPLTTKRWWAAAAAVSVLIISGLWFLSVNKLDKNAANTEGWSDAVNTTQTPMTFKLTDSSTIVLQPNSRLRFPISFAADKREVFLSGDAFFDITKNPNQPFFVHSGEVVAQVLGTSFWIKKDNPDSEGKRNIVVEVVSGRVSVFKKKQNEKTTNTEGVVLTPNLKATYLADNQLFVTGLVEKPVLIANNNQQINAPQLRSPNFNFNDTPLADVLTILEKSYGVKIELAREAMRDCTLTADLGEANLFEKLDLICGTINAQYSVQGTTILVVGRGCE